MPSAVLDYATHMRSNEMLSGAIALMRQNALTAMNVAGQPYMTMTTVLHCDYHIQGVLLYEPYYGQT